MIQQPTNEAILPEEVAKAVTAARNNVTLMNAEHARLQELIGTQQYQLVEIGKQIEEKGGRLALMADEIVAHEKQLSDLQAQVSIAQEDMQKAKVENEKATTDTIARLNVTVEKEQQIAQKEADLAVRSGELDKRSSAIDTREQAIAEREQKHKDFVATL